MINTIIWDLDGTILNTLDALSDSVNYALQSSGLPKRNKTEIRRYLGNGIRNLVQQSAPKNITEELFEQTFQTFRSYYFEHCLIKTKPYEGITELMAQLKTDDYKMAIVSNKAQKAVTDLNNKFFSEHITIAIGEQEGIQRKPAPDMVNNALELLGSSPAHTVYIGDSEVDLQTARNAQMPCISVLWGFRDKDFLIQHGATAFAEKPQDIKTLLSLSVPTNA